MYSFYRTKKHKIADLKGVAGHNFRTRPTPNADPSRLSENLTRGVTDIEAAVRKRCSDLNLNVTAGKVAAVEHLFTASPEFFEDKKKSEIREWAQHCVDYLDAKYGLENIVSVSLHLDEKTPHLHAIHVPITTFKRVNVTGDNGKPTQQLVDTGKPRLNAAAMFAGSKQVMRDLQTEVAEHVQKKYPHLARGEDARETKRTHQSLAELFDGLNKKAHKAIKGIFSSFKKINNSNKLRKGKAYEELFNEQILPDLVRINEQLIVLKDENQRLKKNTKTMEKTASQLSSSKLNQQKQAAEQKVLELQQQMQELERTNRRLMTQIDEQESEFNRRIDAGIKATEQVADQARKGLERDYATIFTRLATVESRSPGIINKNLRTLDLNRFARTEEQASYAAKAQPPVRNAGPKMV